ncbi:MAG: hypothetical protein HC933_01580 [Pleurocapsa sp. SU_196_0]|nr:hypothetical protein [Pleurocapsa sp. SU_196_0]
MQHYIKARDHGYDADLSKDNIFEAVATATKKGDAQAVTWYIQAYPDTSLGNLTERIKKISLTAPSAPLRVVSRDLHAFEDNGRINRAAQNQSAASASSFFFPFFTATSSIAVGVASRACLR